MDRVLFVRHALSAGTRRAAFPPTTGACARDGCEPLDRAGAVQATALRGVLPRPDHSWASFAARALETARLAGCDAQPYAELAECDFGRWAGLLPAEVHAADPDGLAAWYANPDTAPHGGERLADVRARAAAVLARAIRVGGTIVAFTHGGLVKAALLEALGLGAQAIWKLDVAPASITELHPSGAGGGWRVVRVNWTIRLPRTRASPQGPPGKVSSFAPGGDPRVRASPQGPPANATSFTPGRDPRVRASPQDLPANATSFAPGGDPT
jgi:broad specificity phosphatase PhoE